MSILIAAERAAMLSGFSVDTIVANRRTWVTEKAEAEVMARIRRIMRYMSFDRLEYLGAVFPLLELGDFVLLVSAHSSEAKRIFEEWDCTFPHFHALATELGFALLDRVRRVHAENAIYN